jgi:hypothetical protein
MKKLLIVGLLAAGAVSALAQGTVVFNNAGTGLSGVAGPVMFAGDNRPGAPIGGPGAAAGTAFLAQLQYNNAGTWTDVGPSQPFRTGGAAGYWQAPPTAVAIPGIAGGANATLRVAAWAAELGSSYSAALASGLGGAGLSNELTVALGGAGEPPTLPATLVGLQAINISAVVPEPSIAALGLLGAGLLLIRRKK